MIKSCFATAFLLLAASAALADYAPKTRDVSRGDVAASCASLGTDGKGWGLAGGAGAYGCQNLSTGQAITCKPDGTCTDYVGDPRWKSIHDILNKAGKRKQQPI